MEFKELTAEQYEEAISDHVAVVMVKKYLDECEQNGTQPDIEWLRFLMK